MKFLFSLFFVSIISQAYAQTTAPITAYFDKQWKIVTTPALAAYYRTIEQNERGFLVRDYFISGRKQMEVECSAVGDDLYKEGRQVIYYENENIKEEGRYHYNIKTGVCKTYYENGRLKSEVEYQGEDIRYNHYWSEAGEDILKNGEGIVREDSANGYDHYVCIHKFRIVDTFQIKRSTGDTVYVVTEAQPEYVGGYGQMVADIKSNMTYPASARKRGIRGIVYVAFVVDKDGSIRDLEIVRGIDPECDAAAMQAISKLKRWKPGMQSRDIPGQPPTPVSVRFTMPIKFDR